jgi:hypothetical protein
MDDPWTRLAIQVLPFAALGLLLLVFWGIRAVKYVRQKNNDFWNYEAPRLPH